MFFSAADYIDHHFSEKIYIDTIAEMIYISPLSLEAHFQKRNRYDR